MTRVRIAGALIVAGLLTWLLLPHVFTEFSSVRAKIVRSDLVADAPHYEVPVPATSGIDDVRPPIAAIVRLKNDGASNLSVRISFDDRPSCTAEVSPGGVPPCSGCRGRRCDALRGPRGPAWIPRTASRRHSEPDKRSAMRAPFYDVTP